MTKFVVVDIETANPDLTSICQIGIAVFENGNLIDQWESLINPNAYFDEMNVYIHGITPSMVRNSPTIKQVESKIKGYFADNVVCSYGAFDRVSLTRIFPDLQNKWLDIMRVVRRSWDNKFSIKGYGLSKVAKHLKIEQLNHHQALDDAITAGKVLHKAIEDSSSDLDYWFDRVKKPMIEHLDENGNEQHKIKRQGNPDGALYGEIMVFTGELSMPRHLAADKAAAVGCTVVDGVSKKVTLLVKGYQDESRLRGKELSNKEIKARDLISQGHKMQIISEDDFINLIS
jgi:exonuclease